MPRRVLWVGSPNISGFGVGFWASATKDPKDLLVAQCSATPAPKGPSRTKNTTDSKFTTGSKFASAIVKPGKADFGTGTVRKAFFDFFFGLILDPRGYIILCFYSEKRQIHLYRPFFSPLHRLFEKRGGSGTGIRFLLPENTTADTLNPLFLREIEQQIATDSKKLRQ